MALRPELIRLFFETNRKHYGSIGRFLQQEMGIGEQERRLLQQKFTTPA